MHKIANTSEFQHELRQILSYAHSERPSRVRIANELLELSQRVAAEKFKVGDSIVLSKNVPGYRDKGFKAGERVRITHVWKDAVGSDRVEVRSGTGVVATFDPDDIVGKVQ